MALDRADVRITEEGVRLTIRRSKTDQEGKGEEVAIRRGHAPETCAARALDVWLKRRGTAPGPLFRQIVKGGRIRPQRLSVMAVVRAVKGAAARVGLEAADVSGHSLRAGLATSAAKKGASLTQIMKQTRHRSVQTARESVRDAELWQDNVTGRVM